MILFLTLVIIAFAFAYVAYPLFRPRPAEKAGGEEKGDILSQRDTTYTALKELEFDFQMGNLSKAEYRDLEARYQKKAITVLKELDRVEKGKGAEDELEREIAARRRKAPPSRGEEELEREIAARRRRVPPPPGKETVTEEAGVRRPAKRFCPQCGVPVEAGDRFCSQCGHHLASGDKA